MTKTLAPQREHQRFVAIPITFFYFSKIVTIFYPWIRIWSYNSKEDTPIDSIPPNPR